MNSKRDGDADFGAFVKRQQASAAEADDWRV